MTRRVGLGPKPLGVLRIEVFEWLEPLGCKIPPPFSFNLSVLGARGWSEHYELGLTCVHGTVDDS